jgi:hypothetical protein
MQSEGTLVKDNQSKIARRIIKLNNSEDKRSDGMTNSHSGQLSFERTTKLLDYLPTSKGFILACSL